MNRASLTKLIHTGARYFGWDDDTRRAWIAKHTGKHSCSECNEAELSHLGDELRVLGFQPTAPSKPPGGDGPGRPTRKQWALVAKLTKEKGFTGLDDHRLTSLCRKVAKVDHPRFLDRQGMRSLILAMERWIDWGKTHPRKQKSSDAI